MANRLLLYFMFLSMGIHLLSFYLLKAPTNTTIDNSDSVTDNTPQFKIQSIKILGDKNSLSKIQIPNEVETSQKSSGPKSQLHLSDLSLLPATSQHRFHSKLRPNKEAKTNTKTNDNKLTSAQKILKIEAQEMKEIFNQKHAGDVLSQNFDNNDIDVKFVVPKGVPQDELNKFEMQFYSFRMRAAIRYLTTFYKELYDFERKNPHLKFPITKKNEQLTGMITYDKDGNIVRIKMVQWTDEDKLQDFFLSMLKKLDTLPNPPKQMVENGEFTVYYGLNINL